MKEGWKIVKLGDVANIVGGSTPKTNIKSYWNGNHCWVTPAELHGEKYINKTERSITEEAIAKTNLTLLPKGTVLLSSRAPIGKVSITQVPMYCNQGFKNIVCFENLFNGYIYYYLIAKVDYLNSLGAGATFKEISKRVVESVEIPLPPLPEQQRIVGILDAVFEKIEALKANAEKNLENAKALFQQVLAIELEPQEGWDHYLFSEIIKLQSGDNLPAKQFKDGKYPVYGGNGIAGFHNLYNRKGNNIIIGRVGALCGNVHLVKIPFWLTDNGFEVIISEKVNICIDFLAHYLSYLRLGNFARQTAQPVISNSSLKNIKLTIPPISEQQRIVATLDTLSAKCRHLEEVAQKTIAECDALKQSILRQAFNGEL